MDQPLYHGGLRKLDGSKGGLILPPEKTGAPTNADYGAEGTCRRDRVYLTTNIDAASIFACLAPGEPGDVYLVTPLGELEDDPDYSGDGYESFQCEAARIVRVVRRRVKAVQGMDRRALARMLTADGDPFTSALRAEGAA